MAYVILKFDINEVFNPQSHSSCCLLVQYTLFCPMQVRQNVSLKEYNTFGIDVTAKHFASFGSIEQLEEALQYRREISTNATNPLLILGGGSNVLFTKDVEGLVLKNELKGIELINEDADYYYVKANAGEIWHTLVEH